MTFLSEPRTAEEVAEFAGYSAGEVLDALVAQGIAVRVDGKYQLEGQLAGALSAGAPVDFAAQIERAALLARQVGDVVRTGASAVTAGESVVIARSVALTPNDAARGVVTQILDAVPEMRDAITDGHLLDVGSGVGGFVLTTASLLPGLRATSLELVPEVAAVAVERAKALGVTDRVDIRAMDARDFEALTPYDAVFWAQPFFPEQTRAATLAMIRRSLRPGGILLIQQLDAEPTDDDARAAFTLPRLVARAQGLPFARTLDELVAEIEAAGFALVRTLDIDLGRIALLRRPEESREG
ncbi:SAM-dependent methyltransferase [Paractinoplanes atraurantiacus]|uniref:SAM-dependent methyltransferase n=1 Tax=Paractinoplanes atraurantiacus TaxID=1036182 RepID=UPI0015CF5771|nr:class I SAM-dependent methyltransferase [Actinoplanes atraurantiacus]